MHYTVDKSYNSLFIIFLHNTFGNMALKRRSQGFSKINAGGEVSKTVLERIHGGDMHMHVKARIYGRIHTDEHEEHTQQRYAYGGEFT